MNEKCKLCTREFLCELSGMTRRWCMGHKQADFVPITPMPEPNVPEVNGKIYLEGEEFDISK